MSSLEEAPVEPAAPQEPYNLLRIPLIRRLMTSRWFPGILAWPTLIVFVFITYQLIAGPAKAHDNFGTALTWILWWPVLPIVFLLAGRLWCAICPFGTINDVVQKWVGNNRPVPRFLKRYGIWIIDATFILITWSDHTFGLVESPLHSAVLLLMVTLGVVVSGALFERRTWCRYLCFLGGLSSNYTRGSVVGFSATPEKCATCKSPACYKGNGTVAGCPMFVFPRTMDTTAECNLCGQCVKSCPNDSIRISLRLPGEELWSVKQSKFPVSFLAGVIMGIVFVQNITMLQIWSVVLDWIGRLLGVHNYTVTFTVTFLSLMAVPVGLMLLAGVLAGRANGRSMSANFARFGYAIIPLDMAAHIAHNLFHLLAEGKTIGFTALGFLGRSSHGGSARLLDSATIQVLQYGLIGLGMAASLYAAFRLNRGASSGSRAGGPAAFAPYAVLMLLLAGINIYLFSMPMAMRM
jgi:polyferredoxin